MVSSLHYVLFSITLTIRIDLAHRKTCTNYLLDAFVDLYILAQADCVTYNKGGYGVFGLLLNRNVTCGFRQDAMGRPRIRRPCHWVSGDPSTWTNETRRNLPESRIINHDPIYLDPMDS